MPNELEQIISHGGVSKTQKLLALVHPSLSISAPELTLVRPCEAPQQTLHIEPYTGRNTNVLAASKYFKKHLADDLHAVVLHGSLATNDEVEYSDFDALVVIGNEVVSNAKRLRKVLIGLNKSLRYLRSQDVLQHHGWMVLTERDLLSYSPNYLPLETLSCGRNILTETTIEFTVSLVEQPGSVLAVQALCASIESKIHHPNLVKSAYFLKAFLSELMLLPALTYQVVAGQGVYKRDSFLRVRSHFTTHEWKAIEIASDLRNNWPHYTSGFIHKVNQINPILASYLSKRKSWTIPYELSHKIDGDFRNSVLGFINKCRTLSSAD